jgi:Phage protein D
MLAYLYKQSPPGYTLTVGGAPAGNQLRSRLMSISVVLNDGGQSDQLSFTLDDSQTVTLGRLKLPETGKEIKLSLGYELHKAPMGIFHVDQVSCSGSPGGGSINITAVPKLLLDEKTRTWADTTVGDVISKIAGENDLSAKVSLSLKTKKIVVENQIKETDISFVTRLAKKYDALAKPAGDSLLFLVKGDCKTAAGVPLLPTIITADNIIQWNCNLSDRTEYGSVVAVWHNRVMATQEQVIAGKEGATPINRIPHLYATEDEAKAAATAMLNEKTRDASTLNLTVVGDPGIVAGSSIVLAKIRDKVDGMWIIRSATHTLNSSGYQCSIAAYRTE